MNSNTKKQIRDLADRLAGWKVKRVNIEFQDDSLAAMLYDPRQRYNEERSETWAHDSNHRSGCDCQGCRNGVDPCLHGCHFECVPDCKYFPKEGLQTVNGIIEYKGSPEYDRLLQQWRYHCWLTRTRGRRSTTRRPPNQQQQPPGYSRLSRN